MPRKKHIDDSEAPAAWQAPAKRKALSIRRALNPRYVSATYNPGNGAANPYVVTPAGIDRVRHLSAEGCSLAVIAEGLGISHDVFTDIRKRQPEVQDAVDRGRGAMATELTDILMKHARQGNVVAAIHLSKSRAGFVENAGEVEGVSPKVVHNTQINITIPAPLPAEEALKIIGPIPSEEDEAT